jgi:hypothetical protein
MGEDAAETSALFSGSTETQVLRAFLLEGLSVTRLTKRFPEQWERAEERRERVTEAMASNERLTPASTWDSTNVRTAFGVCSGVSNTHL